MVATGRVREIFADARDVHAGALDQLAGRDIRDAAEKAWCATKRATDALILLRTGQEPPTTALTTEGLLALARESAEVEYLVGRYFTRISYLHGSCFYNGMCGSYTERRIRQTLDYIEDAERLADIEGTIRLGCRGRSHGFGPEAEDELAGFTVMVCSLVGQGDASALAPLVSPHAVRLRILGGRGPVNH